MSAEYRYFCQTCNKHMDDYMKRGYAVLKIVWLYRDVLKAIKDAGADLRIEWQNPDSFAIEHSTHSVFIVCDEDPKFSEQLLHGES